MLPTPAQLLQCQLQLLSLSKPSRHLPSLLKTGSTGPKGRRHCKASRGKQAKPKNHDKRGTRTNHRHAATAAHLKVVPTHWALHGSALNPDAGKFARHEELFQRSEGHSQEIRFSAQGLETTDLSIKGTKATFFIDHKKAPKGRSVTCLNSISACQSEKKNPHCCAWLTSALLAQPKPS